MSRKSDLSDIWKANRDFIYTALKATRGSHPGLASHAWYATRVGAQLPALRLP